MAQPGNEGDIMETMETTQMPAPPKLKKSYRWVLYTFLGLVGLAICVLVIGGLVVRHAILSFVQNYTQTQPVALPKVEDAPEKMDQLTGKFMAFKAALDADKIPEPWVLTADDLNAVVDSIPQIRNKLFFSIDGNQVNAKFSLSLEQLTKGKFKGRHLNGVAQLKVGVANQLLNISIDAIEANAKPLPGYLMKGIRQKNLADAMNNNVSQAQTIQQIDTLEVKDDQIVIKGRSLFQ
jgi:hypothetical protein